MEQDKILIWLPSPLGDAVLCTPGLRAVRNNFPDKRIYFLGGKTIQQLLWPGDFNNEWIQTEELSFFAVVNKMRKFKFSTAILFKNSFGAALTVFMAGIPQRIGYGRDGRSVFLTKKLDPPKEPDGSFKPCSMVDYYLGLADLLGCDINNKQTELLMDQADSLSLLKKLPDFSTQAGPLVILVPGGAFGPSKCWPAERFAEIADKLIEKYNASVMVSVAPVEAEVKSAEQICNSANGLLYSLAETELTIGQLKALFARANLVITNDTGPRHIAIALGRKVITLFGPNNPEWTQSSYEKEIQIIGKAPCVPCAKPQCNQDRHICMESIEVAEVFEAAQNMLEE